MEGRVAEQHESRAYDGEPTRQLRQFQTRLARQHVPRRRLDDAFHVFFARGLRGDDGLQSRRRDQDARHERKGVGEPARAAEPDRQARGHRVDVSGLGAQFREIGSAYRCYVPVLGAAQDDLSVFEGGVNSLFWDIDVGRYYRGSISLQSGEYT